MLCFARICYVKDQKAMFWEIMVYEGQKSYVMEDFAMWRTKNVLQCFAIIWTENLSFAIFCYVMDQKAILCKILLCEGPKSYVLQCFAIIRTEKLCFAMVCYNKDRKAKFCNILL